MVAVVQLVEHLIVVQEVAGSSPVSHPNNGLSSSTMMETSTTLLL